MIIPKGNKWKFRTNSFKINRFRRNKNERRLLKKVRRGK